MDVSAAVFWWVAAGLLVAVELATGTFYLLMIALGLAGAALAAHLGLSFAAQVAAACLLGGGTTVAWHLHRRRQPLPAPVAQNRDVNLDIGERVRVEAWAPDLTARVSYRGSAWSARLQPGAPAAAGEHIVSAVEGNWLILAPAPIPPAPASV